MSAALRMAFDVKSWRQGEQKEAVVDCGKQILKIQIRINKWTEGKDITHMQKAKSGRLCDDLIGGGVRQQEESSLTTAFQWDWWSVEFMCTVQVVLIWSPGGDGNMSLELGRDHFSDMNILKDRSGPETAQWSQDVNVQPWKVPSVFNLSMFYRSWGTRLREL